MSRPDERGVGTIQMLLVAGALMMMLATAIQAGLRGYAGLAARHAANAGANVASAMDGDDAAASAEAAARLDALLGRLVDTRRVTVSRGPTTVEVRVQAGIGHLVPRLFDHVSATAVRPIERFVPSDQP